MTATTDLTSMTAIRHGTPIGTLTLAATEQGLVACSFAPPDQISARLANIPGTDTPAAQTWLDQTRTELDQYFAGTLRSFTIPLDLSLAGKFDQSVLSALESVTYGTTTTYGSLTRALNRPPTDARKVGAALARNPVVIIVPCHRVIGTNNALTGYAGGLPAKRQLLDLEGNDPQLSLNLSG
jgi:methylated-DNA-[protein]-cysteine S-methyltransferase